MDPPIPSYDVDPMIPVEGDGDTPWKPEENTMNNNEPDLSNFDKDFIMKGLARLYKKKILPVELSSRYGHFHSPPMSPADFDAPPAVLLLGPFR
jgi:N-terminal EH-domain containing protein